MPPMNDDDGEVIDLDNPTVPDEGDEGAEAQDRGDHVTEPVAEPSVEALKAIVNAKVDEPDPDDAAAEAHGGIPKGRFNEVNARMKQAEADRTELQARIAALEAKSAPVAQVAAKPEPFDVDVKEQEYLEAIMEGDTAAALAIRKEINGELTRQSKQEVTRELTQEREASSLQSAAAEAITTYPFLDSAAENANPKAIAEVVEWRDFYRSRGQSASEALRNAVGKVAPSYAEPPSAVTKPDTRTPDAIARGIKADAAQPKPLAGTGERSSRVGRDNVETMTEDEFDALPAAEKKRLRGDAA